MDPEHLPGQTPAWSCGPFSHMQAAPGPVRPWPGNWGRGGSQDASSPGRTWKAVCFPVGTRGGLTRGPLPHPETQAAPSSSQCSPACPDLPWRRGVGASSSEFSTQRHSGAEVNGPRACLQAPPSPREAPPVAQGAEWADTPGHGSGLCLPKTRAACCTGKSLPGDLSPHLQDRVPQPSVQGARNPAPG